jgi:hypothetical protein
MISFFLLFSQEPHVKQPSSIRHTSPATTASTSGSGSSTVVGVALDGCSTAPLSALFSSRGGCTPALACNLARSTVNWIASVAARVRK